MYNRLFDDFSHKLNVKARDPQDLVSKPANCEAFDHFKFETLIYDSKNFLTLLLKQYIATEVCNPETLFMQLKMYYKIAIGNGYRVAANSWNNSSIIFIAFP